MKSDNNRKDMEKRRKIAEHAATLGIILIAVALAVPLFNLASTVTWSGYSSGSMPPVRWLSPRRGLPWPTIRPESMRLRRLRRLEFWAGVAFMVGGAFWFYNESRFSASPTVGVLAILRETIMFSLAGAVIQIVAACGSSTDARRRRKGQDRQR